MIYYFDENGVMQSEFNRYPEDRIEIIYPGGSLDITDAAFNDSRTLAAVYLSDKVLENLRGVEL